MSTLEKALKGIITAQSASAKSIATKQLQRKLAKEFREAMRGKDGKTPVKGVDFFTELEILQFINIILSRIRQPEDGKDAVVNNELIIEEVLKLIPKPKDGKRGEKGESIRGKDGIDGKDAEIDTKELRKLSQKPVVDHIKDVDHDLIHDPKMLGSLELDEKTIKEGSVLQIQGGKLVAVDLPKQTQQFAKPAKSHSRYRIQTITESTTLDPLANVVHIDASAASITITFYEAEGNEGSYAYLKRIDSTLSNDVIFAMPNGETIDFDSLYQLVNQGSGAEVYSDGSNFFLKHT